MTRLFIVMNWYLKVLKQYADFSGRARRKEYWMFKLFDGIIAVALIWVMGVGFVLGVVLKCDLLSFLPILLYYVYLLALIIPNIAVLVRRLHDIGNSGWTFFIVLVPLAGIIVLFVWLCTDSQAGKNKWGLNPKGRNFLVLT